MYQIQAKGLTSALIKTGELLRKEGKFSEVRSNLAGSRVKQLCAPIVIEISNPRLRHVFIAERNWNKILPYVESLWIALGWNNLDELPGRYVKSLYKFSDDGKTWRAGYGPRIRHFTGSYEQYAIGRDYGHNGQVYDDLGIDQLKYVIESFKRDPNTRQADITISDPAKDCFIDGNLIQTKDTPCTRSLHFQMNPATDRLDLIVRMRSNDLLWGFSAVNVFNFSLMQEYVANMIKKPIGKYFHIADNLHIYEDFIPTLKRILGYKVSFISNTEDELEDLLPEKEEFMNSSNPIKTFDENIQLIQNVENNTYCGNLKEAEKSMSKLRKGSMFFNDWAAIIANHNIKKNKLGKEVKKGLYLINNPYLKKIYQEFV